MAILSVHFGRDSSEADVHPLMRLTCYASSEDLPGNDPFLDFVGSLIDLADFGIAIDGLEWPVLTSARHRADKAISATALNGVSSHIDRDRAAFDLGHRSKCCWIFVEIG